MPSDKLVLKRQRVRHRSFDLNRSSPQVKEKYSKDNQERRMPPPVNSNIIDMSQTINTAKSTGTVPRLQPEKTVERMDEGDGIHQTVREMVKETVGEMQKALSQSMQDFVTESVNRQLGRVNQNISLLSDAIRGLTVNTQVRGSVNLPSRNEENAVQGASSSRPNPSGEVVDDPPAREQNFPIVGSAYYSASRPRVERFGLKFNGNDTHLSVESFVFRLEHCQRQYRIPWREILDDFHLLVGGPALDWYWLLVETTEVTSWESLRHALLNRFKAHRTNLDIMHELVERRQKIGENINDFFYHVNLLRSKLEQPISEYEIIKLVKRNLRENIGRIVYPISVSSLEQLRIECVEAERNFYRREDRHPPANVNRRSLHELQYDSLSEQAIEVEEVSKEMRCWNCQEVGHSFVECPSEQRTLFCYKCGKPGVITPKCPNCNIRGNNKRGVISTGESRPAKNTPVH